MERKTFELSTSQEESEEILSKGTESYEIDVNDVEVTLSKLSSYCDVPVKEAPKEFEEFTNTVNVLYDTEFYPALHDLIVKYFNKENVIPGTVKAYMVGCLENPSPCSSTCAGSAPSTEGFTPCEHKVIIAVPEGKYSFTLTHQAEGNKALIYTNHPTFEDFPGFCTEDINSLNKLGVEQAIVLGKEDNKFHDFLPLNELKKEEVAEKIVPPTTVVPEQTVPQIVQGNNSTSYTLWIAIGIIVLLLIIFLAWKYWR